MTSICACNKLKYVTADINKLSKNRGLHGYLFRYFFLINCIRIMCGFSSYVNLISEMFRMPKW